jgi:ABC-type dipeptide/oligopeptide/nickel transport system ATPase component
LPQALLEVKDLKVYYKGSHTVKAVDGVSLKVNKGEIVGLIGETGSGKSTVAFAIVRLLPEYAEISGHILFEGKDLLKLDEEKMRKIRGAKISMIFQDPQKYLNPLMKIGDQIAEAIILHQGADKQAAKSLTIEALKSVGMPSPEIYCNFYPFELSGGKCQRALIAMALATKSCLLIADEPTSALDVSIQSQILKLLKEVNSKGLSILLITHDLGIVAQLCDRIYVIHKGKIVEEGNVRNIFKNPKNSYTQALLKAAREISRKS